MQLSVENMKLVIIPEFCNDCANRVDPKYIVQPKLQYKHGPDAFKHITLAMV